MKSYEEIVRDVLELPLHQAAGIQLIDPKDPARGVFIEAGPGTINPRGTLHGGIVPLLIDVASYLAAAEYLEPDTDVVTASNSVSLLRPVPHGARIDVRASVDRIGRNAFFLSARGEYDGQLAATGQIVKAVVSTIPPED